VRPVVAQNIWPWIGAYEGLYCSDGSLFQWLGLDVLGRPCTALGVDLPSPAAMGAIRWRHGRDSTSPQATPDEVAHEWARVYSMADVDPDGSRHCPDGAASSKFRDSTHLYFDVPSLYAWCANKADQIEAALRRLIPRWDSLEACAQLARLRTAWADGPASRWPKLDAALQAGRWGTAGAEPGTASGECMPSDYGRQNPTYRRSYMAVRQLYVLAATTPPDQLPSPIPDGT
jgi:hypothetical protein